VGRSLDWGEDQQQQLPKKQALPEGQAFPQEPQLFKSTCKSTQLPPQAVRPAAQEVQLPKKHAWPEAQVLPQAPQLCRSTCRSTHVPPQGVNPASQAQSQPPHRLAAGEAGSYVPGKAVEIEAGRLRRAERGRRATAPPDRKQAGYPLSHHRFLIPPGERGARGSRHERGSPDPMALPSRGW
jgi:hypothetical protein